MATVEAPIHENVKRAIVAADESHTELLLRKWRNTSRLYKNKVAVEAKAVENDPNVKEFKDIAPYVSGARGRQGMFFLLFSCLMCLFGGDGEG